MTKPGPKVQYHESRTEIHTLVPDRLLAAIKRLSGHGKRTQWILAAIEEKIARDTAKDNQQDQDQDQEQLREEQ